MKFPKCLASELGGFIIYCCITNYPKTMKLETTVSVGQKSGEHLSWSL